ncbi:MAG: hypothetical protein KAS13_09235 [Candidatus Omnitrophica bacterium]|nr:hypothetical protein [Candidatus Omnitrophota bacterium]
MKNKINISKTITFTLAVFLTFQVTGSSLGIEITTNLSPKSHISALKTKKIWQKYLSLTHVSNMISKYSDGRINDQIDKNQDLQMMSQYPEVSTLWFMYFLTSILIENPAADISDHFWRLERNYPKSFFRSEAIFRQTQNLIYSLQKKVIGENIYIVSNELGVRILIDNKNLVFFEPINIIEKQKNLNVNDEVNVSI